MIEPFIEEARRALPVFWPLQSFIATNPLWDLHEQPLQEVLMKLKKFTAIEGVMSLQFYQTLYEDGKIQESDILQALLEYSNTSNCDIPEIGPENSQEPLKPFLNHSLSTPPLNEHQQNNLVKSPILISEILDSQQNENIVLTIKKKVLEFLMLYFDPSQTSIHKIQNTELYENWSQLVANHHPGLTDIVKKLPPSKFTAVSQLLTEFKVLPEKQTDYLTGIYFQMLGWSSLIKWLEQRPDNPWVKMQGSLVDIALIWLCYEKYYGLKNQAVLSEIKLNDSVELEPRQADELKTRLIWQRAYELAYERELSCKLQNNIHQKNIDKATPLAAQAIFCIDTRSEGIRRHLEAIPGYETYGFAGFFGFVFKYNTSAESCGTLQCPALFPPEVQLHSESKSDCIYTQTHHFFNALNETKKSLLTPFAFVEITGLWYALAMLLKSIIPESFQRLKKNLGHDRQAKILNTVITPAQVGHAFSLESRVNDSIRFLKTIGLTKNFAPLVLICGHGAETENNPYQASLDCGACGGNAGYANAIVVCHILNDSHVREAMRSQKIDIPETTYFIAGFHNTTRDEMTLYEQDLPLSHKKALSKLKIDLRTAAGLLRQERKQDLPGQFDVNNRSTHWAELIPEMALIKNSALIIGPRHLTENISLERRVFLHSYEPDNDPDGQLLTGILFGPLIVAHWINAQYYFSTTDPHIYGSGNKMLHNVVSGLGVMEGNFSDLKIGLPWQSVAFKDEILHEPLRLLVIIYAPKLLVESLLSQHPTIQALFTGQWAHLKIIEPENNNLKGAM
jgi:uncharacterized protein